MRGTQNNGNRPRRWDPPGARRRSIRALLERGPYARPMECEYARCALPAEIGFRFCSRHLKGPPPSKYLRRRMAQRQITATELAQALASPDTQYQSDVHPDRTVILGRTIFGGCLKVVVRTDDPQYVITAAERYVEE